MTRSKAFKIIAALQKIREKVDDKVASQAADLYPSMKYNGELIAYQTRILWHEQLKRAAVDLWDTEENNPDNAPNLWEDINYIDGVRVIPEVITAAAAFALDELGYWKGNVYKSLINANVYTPDQYPAGWQILLQDET
jgi:hypothetical protein